MHKHVHTVIGLLAGLVAGQALAQNLEMTGTPAAQSVPAPSRGQSMAQVEQRFGEPSQRVAAVGEPPISRWVYPQFVVYFEHSHVVHAVTRQGAPAT
jgi:hypothetical protein